MSGTRYYSIVIAYDGFGRARLPSREIDYVVPADSASSAVMWAKPADIVYCTALTSAQLNATASMPGTFSYTPPLGTRLSAGNAQTLVMVFTPTDQATYPIVTRSVTIHVLRAPLTITANNRSKLYGAAVATLTAS